MQLSLLTRDQVLANMVASVQSAASAAGFTLSLNEGSGILAVLDGIAGMYLWLQWLAVQVLGTARLTTSYGADVDSFCGDDFGCLRLPGAAASGVATFARYVSTSSAVIPVGTVAKTTDGTQSFAVVADSTNAAWQGTNGTYPSGYFMIAAGVSSVNLTVQNLVVGTAGNILANALGLVASALPGVDTVTNAAAFTNGLNAESDAAYKSRFGLFLAALARGTVTAVESAALGVQQNLTCAVLSNQAAIGGSAVPGSFVVAVDDGSGATPSETITAVANAVDAVRPVGSTAYVLQATVIDAVVVLTLTCATTALHTQAVAAVQAAVTAYIAALPVATGSNNASFPYWRIGQLAFDASPLVQTVTAVTLNGGTVDIGGTPGTVVRVGSVSVN
jgi:hypothetical protein